MRQRREGERERKRHAWQEEMRALEHLTESMNGNDDEWESVVQERRKKEKSVSFSYSTTTTTHIQHKYIYWLCKKTISFRIHLLPTNLLTLH
jgi:hypothetical protein